MSARLRSLDAVRAVFEGLGADVTPRVDRLSFPTLWGPDHPAWILWDAEHRLVGISQTLPGVAEGDRARAALEIQRIHLGLSMLGFVLDPDSGALDFRTHIPWLADDSVRRDLLLQTFKWVEEVCQHQAVRITLGPELVQPWWADG